MSWWWFAFPPCNQSVLANRRLSFSIARQMGRSVRRQQHIQFFRKLEGAAAEDEPSFSVWKTHESGALRLVLDVEGWDTLVVSPHRRDIMSQTVVSGEWGALRDENASFRSVPRTQPHVHAVVRLRRAIICLPQLQVLPVIQGRTSVFIRPHLRTKTDEAEGNSGGKVSDVGRRSVRVEG